jgi:hypothetical protein
MSYVGVKYFTFLSKRRIICTNKQTDKAILTCFKFIIKREYCHNFRIFWIFIFQVGVLCDTCQACQFLPLRILKPEKLVICALLSYTVAL